VDCTFWAGTTVLARGCPAIAPIGISGSETLPARTGTPLPPAPAQELTPTGVGAGSLSGTDAHGTDVAAAGELENLTKSPECGASTKLPPPMYMPTAEAVEEDDVTRREFG
jgi:hypothetical protein